MRISRAPTRILINAGLDGLLAGIAVPLAQFLANPEADPFTPLWAIPWGAAALLLAGIPFRLSVQYWRFAAVGDLLGVAAASIAAAALFPVVLHEAGILPVTLAFPAIHALVLMVLLSLPERHGATALLDEIHYVELSDRTDFNDRFVDELAFPV